MSTIRDQEKQNSRQLETLRRSNQREIKKIEDIHQDRKGEVHKMNQGEIVNLRDEHDRQIAADSDKKEKVLSEMKGNLDKTRLMTDKELSELKQKSSKIKNEEQKKLTGDREAMVADHEFYLEDLNGRFNEASKRVNDDGKSRIEERKATLQDEYAQSEDLYKTKLHQQTNDRTTQIRREATTFDKLKTDQEKRFKHEQRTTNLQHQADLTKKTEQHTSFATSRNKAFRKDIKDQDLEFEKKYAAHMKIHQDNVGRLNQQHEKIVMSKKNELVAQLATTDKRSDDPFYRFTDIRPTLTQHPDHIEVQVVVSDHSKQDLQLTTNNKEVVLNFNRRYDDSHTPTKGVVNKLHKVESYTTRLTADFILDPKSVKSTYENGIMTYTIGRA